MALLYRATLVPSKLELVATWAPKQPWFVGDRGVPITLVASFRFDDPDGEVGVETLLVRAGGGAVMQIPLTYRNEQRPGSQEGFIGHTEHSVLGTRWVYDGTTDPVYLGELARAILSGGTQVEQWIEVDGVMMLREPTAEVVGSGDGSALDLESVVLQVVRVPVVDVPVVDAPVGGGSGGRGADGLVLRGTWTDHPEPTILATAETS